MVFIFFRSCHAGKTVLKLLTDLIRIEITRNGDYDIIEGIFSGDIVLYIVVGDRIETFRRPENRF